ncbi:MAG: ergothioneine biosynthesis protein EgtB [Hyphomicrobiales bacterium]|nr:ergothioneine biosynthesis protein EgtB [Hyphomicrobiales bacterium]
MPLDRAVPAESAVTRDAHSGVLTERLFQTRRLSLDLAEPLSDEDQVVQAMEDASPTKWHLAHSTWFFERFVLAGFAPGYRVFDESFEYCFNSYYEAVGPRHPRPQRGLLTRPGASQVRAYRAHVDEALEALLSDGSDALPDKAQALIALGIYHEQQHQELLLTDILSLFAANPLKPAYRAPAPAAVPADQAPLAWIAFPGGVREVGHDGRGFAYDNEGPRHEVLLQPFKLASRAVTNGEWQAFMDDGGYETSALWLSDGWLTVQSEGWEAPLYWERGDDGWEQMGLRGLQPVDPAAPVRHVSYFEADAFARWAGKRLPSEFEWEVAAEGLPVEGRMLDMSVLRPLPAPSDGDGLQQMFGDVWEWTHSAYAPYPGFAAAEGALGEYNGKFMCNQFVLRGGACTTPEGHVRRTYRNFFYPQQRWQFTGLRLAEAA